MHLTHRDRHGSLALKGHAAREHLVEHDPDCVEVCGWANGQPTCLLGRKILCGTDDRAGLSHLGLSRAGNAEVSHLRLAISLDQNVLGLDVAVDHAFLVGDAERGENLQGEADCALRFERSLAADQLLERLTIDELLHDVRHAVGLRMVVDLHDVRVV